MISTQKGFSLIEMLVVIGIMAIVGAGFSTMMVNQQKEMKALEEKLSAQDLMRSMTASLAKGDVCQYVLQPLPFNATLVQSGTPQTIDLGNNPLYAGMVNPTTPGPTLIKKGDKASPYSNSLEVSAVKFVIENGNFTGTTGSFTGHWLIEFDNSKLVRPMKPVTVSASLVANTTNAASAVSTSCNGNSNGGGGTNPPPSGGFSGRLKVADVIKNFAGAKTANPYAGTPLGNRLDPSVRINDNGQIVNTRGQVICTLSTATGNCAVTTGGGLIGNHQPTIYTPTPSGLQVSTCNIVGGVVNIGLSQDCSTSVMAWEY